MNDNPAEEWKPLSLSEVAGLFAPAEFRWWIAGGFAVELAAGRSIRDHADIDVLVLRKDHAAARELLKEWDCWANDSRGEFGPWSRGEPLPAATHDIWCRENSAGPWRLQIMIDEGDELNWWSRRDSRVTLPLSEFGARSAAGIPYVQPHVLIYYKAKQPRPKDELDLEILAPILTPEQRAWAARSIRVAHGEGHPWLPLLDRP